MATQITVNETGAKTLKDIRPMLVDGQNVYVVVGDVTASLMFAGRVVAERPAAEITSSKDAQDWAVEVRDTAHEIVAGTAPEADVLAVVEALGGTYTTQAQDDEYRWSKVRTLTAGDVADRIRTYRAAGGRAVIRSAADGERWYVEITPENGTCGWAKYWFCGH